MTKFFNIIILTSVFFSNLSFSTNLKVTDAQWQSIQQQILSDSSKALPGEILKIKASNIDAGDKFGWSVAISGNTMVIGAQHEKSASTQINVGELDNSSQLFVGAAYVFVKVGDNWIKQAYLKKPTTGGDWFGTSVAIDGDTIVVGAIYADSPNGNMSNTGAAIVFVRTNNLWSHQASLYGSLAQSGDRLGTSVAIFGDVIVAGVPNDKSDNLLGNNNNADKSGAAYVFERVNGVWTETAYLKSFNIDAGDNFGNSVAVSGDVIVVGAPKEDGLNNAKSSSGGAYVFRKINQNWEPEIHLVAGNPDNSDSFGHAVAIDGNTLAVSAVLESSDSTGVDGVINNLAQSSGAVYVYDFDVLDNIWRSSAFLKAFQLNPSARFGWSLGISDNTIIVGAFIENNNATGVNGQINGELGGSGAAYTFKRSNGVWSMGDYLKASNPGQSDFFGWSVGVSGGNFVIGAPQEGSNSSSDNDLAPDSGAAYVYVEDIIYFNGFE